jgi:hypothetical protein
MVLQGRKLRLDSGKLVARHHDEVRTTTPVPDGGTELFMRLQKKPKAKAEPRPMKQIGKVGRESLATRREWVKQNPSDHAGNWICWICGQAVHKSEMKLDHRLQRSTHPQLRSDLSNLSPSHEVCNNQRTA